jgi:uncharacterized protein (TIGR03067 family)
MNLCASILAAGLVAFLRLPDPPPQLRQLVLQEPKDKPAATPKELQRLPAELQRLQGTWTFDSLEENGVKAGDDKLMGRTIFFGAETFLIREGPRVVQVGTLKVDASRTPKTINAVIKHGQGQGDVMLGIYSLEGGTLKLCFDVQGSDRPKEFKTTRGSNLMLAACKRAHADADQPEIAGTYKSETIEMDGSKHIAEASIDRRGDAYFVVYRKGKGVAYVGIGLRKGDIFCMSWANQGQVGVTLYQIEKGPRLVGLYTQLAGPGLLGQEILTRVEE